MHVTNWILIVVLSLFTGSTAECAAPRSKLTFESTSKTGEYLIRVDSGRGYANASGFKVFSPAATTELRFLHALPSQLEPLGEAVAHSYYFNGSVSAREEHRFSRVLAHNVWPGIGVLLYGSGADLEFDFLVDAGADPSQIRFKLSCNGEAAGLTASQLSFTRSKCGIQKAPVAYQVSGNRTAAITATYKSKPGGAMGLKIGAYDHTSSLVIDPTLTFLSRIGGNGEDNATAVAVDASGNVYLTGQTYSSNFPTQNPFSNGSPGNGFVSKFSPAGDLIFSTYIGGQSPDSPSGIALDATGAIYITGSTSSPNYPATPGALNFGAGSQWTFFTKFSPDGSKLIYSGTIGRAYSETLAYGIALDRSGRAFIVGFTTAADFPSTTNAIQKGVVEVDGDAFLIVLNSNATRIDYGTVFGGNSRDEARAVAVGADGAAWIAGDTSSTNFPTTSVPFGYQTAYGGGDYDAFVIKIDPAQSPKIPYSTYLGSNGSDAALGIALDPSGNPVVTGTTSSRNFPTVRAAQSAFGGGTYDAFVTKLNPGGRSSDLPVIFSTFLGGSGDDRGRGVAIDATGRTFVTGYTNSSNFRVTSDALPSKSQSGDLNGYLSILDSSGLNFSYSTLIAGSSDDVARAVAVSPDGSYLAVVGQSSSSDLPVTARALRSNYSFDGHAFLALFGQPAISNSIQLKSVLNGASYVNGPISPGEVLALFGEGIGPAQAVGLQVGPNSVISNSVAGVRVLFDNYPAPIIYSQAGQTGVVVPFEIAGSNSVQVHVEYGAALSNTLTLPVVPVTPGLFTLNAMGTGPGAILNQNNSVNLPTNPASRGSVVQIYVTGLGPPRTVTQDGQIAMGIGTLATLPTVSIGNIPATVTYAGLSPFLIVGAYQVNAVVPQNAPVGSGVPIVVSSLGVSSQLSATLAIQ